MENKTSSLISRRQALKSLAAITAGTLIKPTSLFAATARSKTRFAVIGDFGTGGSDQFAVGRKMAEMHRESAIEFVLAAGDNIYPNGAGRLLVKNFEQPFADLLRDQVKFYTV